MYDVGIIGGGTAGLMAAKVLAEAGKKVVVIEARDYVGGRIHLIESLSFPAQGGAEFIHGNLPITFGLLKEAGIEKEKLEGTFCRVRKGRWTTGEGIIPHWDLLIKKLKVFDKNLTVEDFLTESLSQKKYEKLRHQFRKYVEGYDAANTKNAAILAIKKEMEEDEEDQYRPIPGYHAVINYLKKSCLNYKTIIKTKEAVQQIAINKSVKLTTSSATYICKQVIIAVPLGVLQSKKNTEDFIKLPDNLNGYTKAARKIGNGGVIKFLLQFDKTFWLDKDFLKEKNIPPPSYIFSDAVIPTWWTQYPSKVPLLTGWIAGPASYKIKHCSGNKFKNVALESLSSIFSYSVTELKKRLINYKVINWIKEAHILGGYSYSTLQTEKARQILNKPFDDKIYFAGEYLAENSSSTVDAALQSGNKVAKRILNME